MLLAAAPRRHAAPLPQYGPPPPPTPYELCEAATISARGKKIPQNLLLAIARVESGRPDPATGRVRPWPWTINVDGVGTYFETKDEAVATVKALQARGTRSVDVGCMQVNLFHHPTAFPSLEAAFDPETNATYAASFLTSLFNQTKDWNLATAFYHSQTQERGEEYQRLVFGRVMTPMGPPLMTAGLAAAWPPPNVMFGAFPPPSIAFGAFPPPINLFGAFAPASVLVLPNLGQGRKSLKARQAALH